jgi:hypothetical protein
MGAKLLTLNLINWCKVRVPKNIETFYGNFPFNIRGNMVASGRFSLSFCLGVVTSEKKT